MIHICPSILSADFSRLAEEIKDVESKGADCIHLDMMDGHFVPNLTFGVPIIAALRKHVSIPFDAHLMVEHPDVYVDGLAKADMILIMSVNPGFGGQKFIPYSLDKIREARALLDSVGNTEAVVEVDGGVNADTVQAVKEAGATFLVAGSAVFGAADRAAAIAALR